MKKARQAVPNQLLKDARELRGWSQKYVADQIGADHYYLSRWERGTASPSPYYRQKLCALFGKDARELGLLPGQPEVQTPPESSTREQGVRLAPPPVREERVIQDPAVPLFVAEGSGL